MELGPTFGSRPVLFPCQDKNVLVLSRARERLDAWYSIALAEPEVVETLADKASFHEYGASVGLPLPPTYVLRDRADAEHAAARLPYPSILKPSVRLRDWSKHTKLKALAPTPLRSCSPTIYDLFSQWASVLVAQQLINGADTNHGHLQLVLRRTRRAGRLLHHPEDPAVATEDPSSVLERGGA